MTDISRDELDKLLPFYVNGTLTEEEKTVVEKQLADDPAFEVERQYLVALHSKIKEQEMEGSPGELGLARLKASIQKEASISPQVVDEPTPAPEPEQDNVVQGWWKPVAIAACLGLAVMSTAQVNTAFFDDGMTTASGGASSGPVLQIFFEEAATEKDIRMLLRQKQLNIIEGPTALGFYRVELIGNGKKPIASVIQALEGHRAISEVLEE